MKNQAATEMVRKGQLMQAVELWQESSETGYVAACYNLALCYETGKGVQKNLTKVSWSRESA